MSLNMLSIRATNYKTAQWSQYRYYPSLGAAILFVVLFLLLTIFHTWKMARTGTLFFLAFVIGGFFEWIGYVGRTISATQSPQWKIGPYVLQSILLLVAPALFAASIYMMLGRIVLVTEGEKYSIISRNWLTTIFVAGDVLCFLLQASGAGLQATGTHNRANVKTGEHVIVGGLVVQIVFFAVFIGTSLIFQWRLNKAPTPNSQSISWRSHMIALYVSSALIMVRSIFRVVEYAQGNNSYLVRNEVYLYLFDSLLMFAMMLLYAWKYPNEITERLRDVPASGHGTELENVAHAR